MISSAAGMADRESLEAFFGGHPVDEYAVAPVSAIHAPPGRGPAGLLPSCRSMIIFGRVMGDDLFHGTYRETAPKVREFKRDIARTSSELARMLEDEGSQAVAVNSVIVREGKVLGSLSLKHCAQDAGMGEIGENTLLITPRYGIRLALGAVVTDRAIDPGPVRESPGKLCSRCGACIRVCPAHALSDGDIDQARCLNMTGAVPPLLIPVLSRFMRSKILEPLATAMANPIARRSGGRCSACLITCPHFTRMGR